MYGLFRLVNRAIPKKDLILFYSTVDFNDNPYYLYKTMVDRGVCEDYQCVWIVNTIEGKTRVEKYGGIAIYRGNRTRLLRCIMGAKYFVSANGPPQWKAENQISIELWHGLPVKLDGVWMIKTKRQVSPDYLVVPSRFSAIIYSSLFDVSPEKILELGFPRTDVLFNHKDDISLKSEIREKLGIPFDSTVVLYAPTWRAWDSNRVRALFEELVLNTRFREIVSKENILFVIKPHPHDNNTLKLLNHVSKKFNIRSISLGDLWKVDLRTEHLLLASDILVTDYSSIFWDFLVLDRPIIFYTPDIVEYRTKRGLVLEPFEVWAPGDIASTPSELVGAIEEALSSPNKHYKKRRFLRDIMFPLKDGKSSERIINYFWGK